MGGTGVTTHRLRRRRLVDVCGDCGSGSVDDGSACGAIFISTATVVGVVYALDLISDQK